MKHKKLMIALAIGIIILFLLILCGYFALRWLDNQMIKNYFIEDAMNFLNSNTEFCEQYGTVIELTSNDSIPIKTQDGDHSRYHMNFECQTDRQTLHLQVIVAWNGEEYEFQYVIQ